MDVLHNIRYFMKKGFMRKPITAIMLTLVLIYLIAMLIVIICEKTDLSGASFMLLPAFLGELGGVESNSFFTKISVIIALLVSIAFLSVITARITSYFIEFCQRGGSVMDKVNFSRHIIICGWNFQGDRIINELLAVDIKNPPRIVILADMETRPTHDERVEFVKGDPTQDEALIRAGLKDADSVIVMSPLQKNANEADAETLMIVLAVESVNRSVHTCVQLLNSANRRHLERAHADEVICLDQIGGNLVVASALHHGISHVVTDLLTFNSGSEFYRYDGNLSDDIKDREFMEVAGKLAGKKIILIGFETDFSDSLFSELSKKDMVYKLNEEERMLVVNPQSPYKIRQGDALFIIAENKPESL